MLGHIRLVFLVFLFIFSWLYIPTKDILDDSCRLWPGTRGVIQKNQKNLNKLLVFEGLYLQPGEDADLGKLQVNSAEKSYNIQKYLIAHAQYILNFLDKMASSR